MSIIGYINYHLSEIRYAYTNRLGKLAHKFTTCYLECISYHLPKDKKLVAEKICKNVYYPCIKGKENQIMKSYQCGFPNKSPCDVNGHYMGNSLTEENGIPVLLIEFM